MGFCPIPAGHPAGPHPCTNLCTGPLVLYLMSNVFGCTTGKSREKYDYSILPEENVSCILFKNKSCMKMFKIIAYSSILFVSLSFPLIQSIPKVVEMESHKFQMCS